jgi:branched-chain amino acid transport system substrate-binding protein
MRKGMFGVGAGLVLVSVLIAGCGGSGAGTGAQKELLIGNIASKSGQYSICAPGDVTLQIAIDEIHTAGGVKVGGGTYTVRMESIDDQSDVATGSTAARTLLQKGAKFIFGPCGAGAASVLQLTQPSNAVVITSASSAAAAIHPGGPREYVMTTIPSIDNRTQSVTAALEQFAPDRRTMVMLGSDDPTWGAVVEGARRNWTGEGRTVEPVLYPPGTSDLGAFVAKVRELNPDILWIGQNPQTVTLALQQLDAAGVSKDLLVVGHGTEPALAAKAGGRPYLAAPFSPGPLTGAGANAASEELVTKYYAATGQNQLPAYAPPLRYFYDTMLILKAAMEKAGTVDDVDAILGEFEGVDTGYQGALGPTSFDADGFIRYPLVTTYVAPDGTQTASTWQPGS